MNSKEYERYSKELEDASREDGESSPPKQVFATLAGADDEDEESREDSASRKDPRSTSAGGTAAGSFPSDAGAIEWSELKVL
jgi:hypothetical protein